MSRITVTLEGATWAEVKAQAAEIAEGRGNLAGVVVTPPRPPGQPTYSGSGINAGVPDYPAPQALPFDKPPASGLVPPPSAGVCPVHMLELRPKPAGVNKAGTPYAAGWRCPTSGCRTFIPDPAIGATVQ